MQITKSIFFWKLYCYKAVLMGKCKQPTLYGDRTPDNLNTIQYNLFIVNQGCPKRAL